MRIAEGASLVNFAISPAGEESEGTPWEDNDEGTSVGGNSSENVTEASGDNE